MIRATWLLALGLAACLPLPPEHTYSDEAHVSVDWKLLGPRDAPATCPAGYDSVLVEACVDETVSQCFHATAPCTGTGSVDLTVYTSGRYRPDSDSSFWDLSSTYWVYLSVVDPTGELRRASSVPLRTDLSSGDAQVDVSVYPDAGFFRLAWDLSSGLTGDSASSCGAVGIDEIELAYAVDTGGTPALNEHVRWPCTHRASTETDPDFTGDGDTPALAAGSYTGNAIAYRAGAEIARAEDVTFTIKEGGEVTDQEVSLEIPDR